jgi:hypothetical protein
MKSIDNKFLKILANRPDLISNFPKWMLSKATVNEIRKTENVAIAEIAGRDSVASVIRASEMRPIKAIIPTIAYTGTEHGTWMEPFEKIEILKYKLQLNNIKVYEPVVLGSPKFWWTLCGRYVAHFFKAYGFYSHCVGCHLYFHAIRIPIARKLNCNLVIGGERESHDGRIKINQTGFALNTYISFLKKFDIELFLPLRDVKSGKEVESVIGFVWDEGEQQLECVLSKNYQSIDGSVLFSEDAIKRYFDEFALKKAEEFINRQITKHNS